MIPNRTKSIMILLILFFLPQWLGALTIKLASPLPEGTQWDNALKRMADEWSEITDGRIRVIIYPGGIAGDESDMVRKMRIGQIDMGIFSAFGLRLMVPETFVLTLPGLLKNDAELDYVLDYFVPQFDERFREEGFEILAWSKSGWANIFSKKPIGSLADFRSVSLALFDSTEADTTKAFKYLGFKVVSVDLNELMMGLQSGIIDAFTVPPILAGAYQWFAMAPYMTNFNITPVFSGMVISQKTWQRIPEEFHRELKVSMTKVASRFYTEAQNMNDEALRVMKNNGLQIIDLGEKELNDFSRLMLSGHELMTGNDKSVPLELYEKIQNDLDAFRK